MPFQKTAVPKPSMERVDADEQLVAVVYRHPFGMLLMYGQVLIGIAAAAGLIFFLLPEFTSHEENPDIYNLIGLGLVIVCVVMALILLLATVIYRQSKLIITNKCITEVTQEGLFNRKISQLAVSNIEDATADRSGIFQTLLNFGVLNIETAGETDNFFFHFCPEPDRYAKTVLEMREQFLANRHRDSFEAGATLATMSAPGTNTNNPQQQTYGPRQQYGVPMPPPQNQELPSPVSPNSIPETDYHEPV